MRPTAVSCGLIDMIGYRSEGPPPITSLAGKKDVTTHAAVPFLNTVVLTMQAVCKNSSVFILNQ
jgi:hypothetical protein